MFKKVATFTDGKGLAGVEFFKDGSMMWYAHYAKWMLLEDGRLKLDFSVLPGAGDVKKVTFEKDTMILAFSERQLEDAHTRHYGRLGPRAGPQARPA